MIYLFVNYSFTSSLLYIPNSEKQRSIEKLLQQQLIEKDKYFTN